MSRRPRDRGSNVWDFFEKDPNPNRDIKIAKCKLCSNKYSYSTITNLKSHIQRKHIEVCPPSFLYAMGHSPDTKTLRSFFIPFHGRSDYVECKLCQPPYQCHTDHLPCHLKKKHPRQFEEMLKTIENVDKLNKKMSNCSKISHCPILVKPTVDTMKEKIKSIWNHFTKLEGTGHSAECNYCHEELSFRSTSYNLNSHLRRMHGKVYRTLLKNSPKSSTVKTDDGETKRKIKTTALIWGYFTKLEGTERKAECNICNREFSYRSTINNLSHHLRKAHSDHYEIYLRDSGQLNNDPKDCSEKTNSEKGSKPRIITSSLIWDYFTRLQGTERKAKCNICNGKFSYHSTINNLSRHLRNVHGDHHKTYLRNSGQLYKDCEDCSEKGPNPRMKTLSLIWDYFTKLESLDRKAECNICKEEFTYCSTILNLYQHLKNEHGDEHKTYLRDYVLLNNGPENNFSEKTYSEIESILKMETTSAYAEVWYHYNKLEGTDHKAECHYCNAKMSYRTSASNLVQHVRSKHKDVYRKYFQKFEQQNNDTTNSQTESQPPMKTTLLIDLHLKTKHEEVHQKYVRDSGLQDNISEASCNLKSDNEKDEESEETHNEVWNYFEQEGSKARCVVCRELVPDSTYEHLKDHLFEHHPKLLLNIVQEQEKQEVESNASNTEENTYTEVVYLERESSPEETKIPEPSSKIRTTFTQQRPKKRTRNSSSSDRTIAKYKKDTTAEQTEDDSELEVFIKYIRCLLKKLSPEVFSKVQVDILKTVMNAQSSSKLTLTETCSLNILSDINSTMDNVIRVSDYPPENSNLIGNYTVTLAKGGEAESSRKD